MAHPKLKVKATNTEKILNILSVIGIIGSIAFTVYMFGILPDIVPTHFDAFGEPNDWGSKGFLGILPIITIIIFLSMYFISKVPHKFNYPMNITENNAPRVYPVARLMLVVVNFEMVLLMSGIQVIIVQSAANGTSPNMLAFILLFLLLPLLTMIISLVKLNHAASE